jgi:exodeoxyribonuclease VII large subunit
MDVINTAAHRCKAVGILVVDVPVQGEGAAEKIARAIRWVDRHHRRLAIDGILVTRGGGSIEDLWAFNERIVADAVFRCTLPVVAAIGHESDTTIIELVADVRASTPTQAAMRLVPSSTEMCRHIEHLAQRLGFLLNRALERQQHHCRRLCGDLQRIVRGELATQRVRLQRFLARLVELQPRAQLASRRARLAVLSDRMQRSMHHYTQRNRDRVAGLERALIAKDPHSVLRRGYSLTTDAAGTIIRSVQHVKPSELIHTRLADGTIDSIIGRTTARGNGRQHRGRKGNTGAAPAGQMDLFAAGR